MTIRYRLAAGQDIPGITALWEEAFHETPVLPDGACYVAQTGSEIVGMLFALPQTLKAETEHKAVYFYAIATKEAYRGRGICRNLMAYAERHVDADCCMLVPASDSLFSFYKSLGYETVFFKERTPFAGGTEISMTRYLAKREAFLPLPHVVYDDLSYAQKIYGLRFYETSDGICAASDNLTAENLPHDLGTRPHGMIKWLKNEEAFTNGYLGFALD